MAPTSTFTAHPFLHEGAETIDNLDELAEHVTGQLDAGATEMATTFVIGGILDLLVIPWPYVFTHYVKMPGDRWKFARPPARPVVPTVTEGGGNQG